MDREDIQSSSGKKRELKSRRKDAAISKLPNEVLVEIFAVLKENSYVLRSWHQITHVCQHWRNVALDAATLWVEPPTFLHHYTLAMLDRSRKSPLAIRLNDRTSIGTSATILRQIRRIESLFVYKRKAGLDHMQDFLSNLGRQALQLRVLKMIQTCPYDDSAFQLSAQTFRHATSLKHISLMMIDLDWQIFPIHSLAILLLDHIRISNPPSWMQFQGALRAMPLLEDLCFSIDDLQLHSPYPSCSEPLYMPHLRRLTINSGLPSTIEGFISHTRLPLLQYAYVACSCRSRSNHDDYSAIISASLSLLTKGDFGYLESLLFAQNHFIVTEFEGPDGGYSRALEFFPPSRVTAQGNARMARDTVATIFGLPDVSSHLTNLILNTTSLTPDQLFHVLGLRQMVTLTAYVCSPLIQILGVPPSPLLDMPIAFPMMEALILVECNDEDRDEDGDVNETALAEQLYDCLSSRRGAYGSGLGVFKLGYEVQGHPASARYCRTCAVRGVHKTY